MGLRRRSFVQSISRQRRKAPEFPWLCWWSWTTVAHEQFAVVEQKIQTIEIRLAAIEKLDPEAGFRAVEGHNANFA